MRILLYKLYTNAYIIIIIIIIIIINSMRFNRFSQNLCHWVIILLKTVQLQDIYRVLLISAREYWERIKLNIYLLKTNRNPLYIRSQSVPRCKHFPPQL